MAFEHFIYIFLFLKVVDGKWFFGETQKIEQIRCQNFTCSILMKVDETKFNGSIFQVRIDLSYTGGRGSINIQQVNDKGSIETVSHKPLEPSKKLQKIFCDQQRCVDEVCIGKGKFIHDIWTPRITFENSWVGPGIGLKILNERLVVQKYGENNVGYWYSSCDDDWKYETKKFGEKVEVLYL